MDHVRSGVAIPIIAGIKALGLLLILLFASLACVAGPGQLRVHRLPLDGGLGAHVLPSEGHGRGGGARRKGLTRGGVPNKHFEDEDAECPPIARG